MTESVRVLVVDDSDDLRDLISLVINNHPGSWQVVATAADGRQAIEVAKACRPDLVLIDIAMPIMDGMQALPLLRATVPEAVVVMLSGYPLATAGQGALNAGAHGYLEKSDLVRSLVPRLEGILSAIQRHLSNQSTSLFPDHSQSSTPCQPPSIGVSSRSPSAA